MKKFIFFLEKETIISIAKIENECFEKITQFSEIEIKWNSPYSFREKYVLDTFIHDFFSTYTDIDELEFILVDCGSNMIPRRRIEETLKEYTNNICGVVFTQIIGMYVVWKKVISKKGESIRVQYSNHFYDISINAIGLVEVKKAPSARKNVMQITEEELCLFLRPDLLTGSPQIELQDDKKIRTLKDQLEEKNFELQMQLDSQAIELEHLKGELAQLKGDPQSSPLSGFSFTLGSIVRFGTLGDQKIEWVVLERKGSQALLLCRTGFNTTPFDLCPAFWQEGGFFDRETPDKVTNLSFWLNERLLPFLFTEEEQAYIVPREIFSKDKKIKEGIFLMSKGEAENYFSTNPSLLSLFVKQYGWSWTDSSGNYSSFTTDQNYNIGSIRLDYLHCERGVDCRPALWVSI